ncbi:MAG: imidazolonepropionase [Cyanobacteria bacterium]|nr:imidazolonepropionase [Cyanobacteriota bacterium]
MKTGIRAVVNAGELVTAHAKEPKRRDSLADLGIIKGGAVVYEGDTILDVGTTEQMLEQYKPDTVLDANGRVVMPGFVDPHAHLVYMGSRHEEYESKIAGKSYTDLHKVGGIRYTVRMTRGASEDELFEKASRDLDIMLLHGTTTVEAKSGYGLDLENELKLLRVAKRLDKSHPVDVISTFLGAHTVPEEFKDNQTGYAKLVREMLKDVAPLAEFCDVWCDALGFTVDECRAILDDAKKLGLKPKLHAEQTAWSGGGELAAEVDAVSADHLDFLSPKAIEQLRNTDVIGVLLPGVTYHLMEFSKKIPAKEMIESGMAIALATDYNPGSCRTQSMQAILEAACRLYRLTYAQAINAATINAAFAIDRGDSIGSLAAGKRADIIVLDCSEHGIVINNFGINHVRTVIKNGAIVVKEGQLQHLKQCSSK